MEYITTLEEYNADIAKAKQEGAKEERERILKIISERYIEHHKKCLTDMFINGRFWEGKDLEEILIH